MATNYGKLYQSSKRALGEPTAEFVEFFSSYENKRAKVLDIGCGQGRDALFIARLGHSVRGVDLSPSGIQDLLEEAAAEGLDIKADVADIRTYPPCELYDVLGIDRTLHMLTPEEMSSVLRNLLGFLNEHGTVLIADETSNIPRLQAVFDESDCAWAVLLKKRGYLFVQRKQAMV